MSHITTIIILVATIITAIVILIAIYRNMKKQEREEKQKEVEEKEESLRNEYYSPRKKKKKVIEHVEMDKEITFKRPGPLKGVTWYNKKDLVRKHFEKKRITMSNFEIISLEYTSYNGTRKKAQGYWTFTVKYG